MRSFKLLERRARYIFAAIGFVTLGVVAPFASAAQVTERSIELSSSTKAATGVSYNINFTSVGAGGGFVVDFCSNTPLIGEACTSPTGFSVSSATTASAGWTRTVVDANTIKLTGTIAAATAISVAIDNVTNPTNAGALYARVVTYDAAGDMSNYVSATDYGANTEDEGSVALSITDGVNVSGAVLESMTFCVSGETIDPNCVGGGASAPALTAPTLKLGNNVGGVIALDSLAVYQGTIYTQISTNASKGAIVSLKSNALSCGGLIRSSDPSACNIGPAGTSGDIDPAEALFGVKLGADVTDATNGDIVAASANYNSSNFRLNYVAGNGTGVTSTYGDPILDTNEKPANNRNMPLTFGASVTNNTPAGNYSAQLSLVATGKF